MFTRSRAFSIASEMRRNYFRHKGFIKYMRPHHHEMFPFHKSEIESTGPTKARRKGAIPQPPFSLCLGQILPVKEKDSIVKVQIHKLSLNRFVLKVS